MDVETRETENGAEIVVTSEKKVAVVVEGEEERIYLPGTSSEDSTYYVSGVEGLEEKEDLYRVVHDGDIDNVEVFAK